MAPAIIPDRPQSNLAAVRYHDGRRNTSALVKRGRTRLQAVVIEDAGVRLITEPLQSERYCTPLMLNDQPYPLAQLVGNLRRIGSERGITAAAVAILDEAENTPPVPIDEAQLPATYQTARRALVDCEQIDECKDWADKAAALAAYARMAGDQTLRTMAVRIQDRATRRMGELLKEVPAAHGRRTDLEEEPHRGAPTRLETARQAGLSRDQMIAALRVANVPEADFEQAVESAQPPTVTALAERGRARRLKQPRSCKVPRFSDLVVQVLACDSGELGTALKKRATAAWLREFIEALQ